MATNNELLIDIAACMNLLSNVTNELHSKIKQTTNPEDFKFLEEKYIKLTAANLHLSELHMFTTNAK